DVRIVPDPGAEQHEEVRPSVEGEIDGARLAFDVEVHRNLRHEHLGPLVHRIKQLEAKGARPLVCTDRVPDPIGDELRAQGVAYLDRGGNAWLQAPGLRILITGRKPATGRTRRPGMRGTDIRLLGEFLRNPEAGGLA